MQGREDLYGYGFGLRDASQVEAGDQGRQLEVENKVIDFVLREVAHPVCKILATHIDAPTVIDLQYLRLRRVVSKCRDRI